VAKHDAYQRELKTEMDRLEEKLKDKMEEEDKAMRDKIKKLTQQSAKSSTAIETMRQQVRGGAIKTIESSKMKSKRRYRCKMNVIFFSQRWMWSPTLTVFGTCIIRNEPTFFVPLFFAIVFFSYFLFAIFSLRNASPNSL
jgi:hypothetical protein